MKKHFVVLLTLLLCQPAFAQDRKTMRGAGGVVSQSGGSPTTVATDDFNRADGSPGANWSKISQDDMSVVDDKLLYGGSSGSNYYWNANTFNDNQWGEIEAANSLGGFYGIICRASTSTEDYYYVSAGPTGDANIYVGRVDAGADNLLATIPYTPALGQRLRVEVSGSATVSIVVKYNGSQVGSTVNDSSANRKLSGRVGTTGYSQYADNWAGGNL